MAAMKEMPLESILGSMYEIERYGKFNEQRPVLILVVMDRKMGICSSYILFDCFNGSGCPYAKYRVDCTFQLVATIFCRHHGREKK